MKEKIMKLCSWVARFKNLCKIKMTDEEFVWLYSEFKEKVERKTSRLHPRSADYNFADIYFQKEEGEWQVIALDPHHLESVSFPLRELDD